MNHEHLPLQPAAAHLSDDDLDDVLIGAGSPAADAHLATCAACGSRLAAFQSTVAVFSKASLAWSEAKSNTLTRDLLASQPSTPRFSLAAAGSFAAALVVAVALSFGLHRDSNDRDAPTLQARTTTVMEVSADREQEISGDNAMLKAIDSELYRSEPSPLELYDLDKTQPAAPQPASPRGAKE